MNTQPIHDPVTGDLRGQSVTTAIPGDISVGDLPNTDTPTDDMRGYEPSPTTDPKQNNKGMIVSAAAVAGLIGAIGIFAYATGGSTPTPPDPAVVAANSVQPALPIAAPQAPVVPSPVVPSVAVEQPTVLAPVAKPPAAPSHRSAAQITRKSVMAPPETVLPAIAPVAPITTAPLEAAPIEPAPTATEPTPQSMPDQPAPPAPQTPPAQPPQ